MVGNGSNLLVGDKGFRGTIISTERLTELEVYKNENSIIAGAGVMLSKLANTAAREKLTGLEFAAGIPGTVGGAVMMNAGADVYKRQCSRSRRSYRSLHRIKMWQISFTV